jgi:putative hydrolase of the HAD superfamily
MGRWRAVVFDLDDTLYPERDYVLSGLEAVAAWAESRLGTPAVQNLTELRTLFERGVRGTVFNVWLDAHGLRDQRLVTDLVQIYRTHRPTISPFPEVPALLTSLRQRCLLGLVSDGFGTVQRQKLTALRLQEHFAAVVFSDDLGPHAWKPNPEPLVRVLQDLGGIDPWHSIYVADNPAKDFIAARRAGMASIRVRRRDGEYSHLEPSTAEHEPNLTVSSLQALEFYLLTQTIVP